MVTDVLSDVTPASSQPPHSPRFAIASRSLRENVNMFRSLVVVARNSVFYQSQYALRSISRRKGHATALTTIYHTSAPHSLGSPGEESMASLLSSWVGSTFLFMPTCVMNSAHLPLPLHPPPTSPLTHSDVVDCQPLAPLATAASLNWCWPEVSPLSYRLLCIKQQVHLNHPPPNHAQLRSPSGAV